MRAAIAAAGRSRSPTTPSTFGPLMLTKRACQAGPSSVEQAVTTVLTGTVSYTIDADLLTIDAGGPGLVFRAAP